MEAPLNQLWTRWPNRDLLGSHPAVRGWSGPAEDARALPIESWIVGHRLTIRIGLPGIDPVGDLELAVEDSTLVLTVNRSRPADHRDVLASEFGYGRLVRRMGLGDEAVVGLLRATFETGMLTVVVPLEAQRRNRRVICIGYRRDDGRRIEPDRRCPAG